MIETKFENLMLAIGGIINRLFQYVFPEFSYVGIVLIAVCAIIFIVYSIKSGIKQGFNITVTAFVMISIILFLLYVLQKAFAHHHLTI